MELSTRNCQTWNGSELKRCRVEGKMARSKSARLLSVVLELFSMYTEKNGEKMIEKALGDVVPDTI